MRGDYHLFDTMVDVHLRYDCSGQPLLGDLAVRATVFAHYCGLQETGTYFDKKTLVHEGPPTSTARLSVGHASSSADHVSCRVSV